MAELFNIEAGEGDDSTGEDSVEEDEGNGEEAPRLPDEEMPNTLLDEEWTVGWDKLTWSAWRAPRNNLDNKEFTNDLRIPEGASDFDACVAWWGDWSSQIDSVTVLMKRERDGQGVVRFLNKSYMLSWSIRK